MRPSRSTGEAGEPTPQSSAMIAPGSCALAMSSLTRSASMWEESRHQAAQRPVLAGNRHLTRARSGSSVDGVQRLGAVFAERHRSRVAGATRCQECDQRGIDPGHIHSDCGDQFVWRCAQGRKHPGDGAGVWSGVINGNAPPHPDVAIP